MSPCTRSSIQTMEKWALCVCVSPWHGSNMQVIISDIVGISPIGVGYIHNLLGGKKSIISVLFVQFPELIKYRLSKKNQVMNGACL